MRKHILLLIAVFTISTILVGCSKTDNGKELRVILNDKIKATTKIVEINDERHIKVDFPRKKKGTKYKIDLAYYKDNKEVYNESIIYIFPDKNTECKLDILIKEELMKIKGVNSEAIKNKDYTLENMEKEVLEHDYINLSISKYTKK